MEIIVNFQPFTREQEILVFGEGGIQCRTSADIDNLVDIVNGLKTQYNATNIKLVGNENYLSNFKAKMNNRFGSNDCTIEIISRR